MPPEQARAYYMEQVKRSASWFYLIAGLSIVNSLLQFAGVQFTLTVGLGYTQIVDAFTQLDYGVAPSTALFVDVLIAGLFAAFGYFGRNGIRRIFIVGMALYAFDGLFFLATGAIFSVLIHGVVLFQLYKGVQALGSVDKVDSLVKKDMMPY